MEKLTLVFSRHPTISSAIVRLATWSPWAHCGVVYENWSETRVIEAHPIHGVRDVILSTYLENASKYAFKTIEVPNAAAGVAWAHTQIGKKYDWAGVLAFVGRNEQWNSEEDWFCSEFTEAAILAAGRQRFSSHMKRVTPQHCWMVV